MQLRTLAAATMLATAALMSGGASALASDPWQFGAQIYMFLPSVDAQSRFPSDGTDPGVSVDVGKLIDELQFVFMGSLEAKKGRWGAMTDVIYLNLGGNPSGTRDLTIGEIPIPASASAAVDYELEGWALMLAGEYAARSEPASTIDVFSGARMLEIEQKIDWELQGDIGGIPEEGRSGNSTVGRTNWDAIIGMKGRWSYQAENRWFVPYYLDVGAGESEFTWQAMAGLGYSWQWIDTSAAWRYLDYDLGKGRPLTSLSLNGPVVSVRFHW